MKTLRSYTAKAFQEVRRFPGEKGAVSPERLHQFRLAMKHLRFVARLLHRLGLDSSESRAFEKKVRPLFRAAGKVRELHLFGQLIQPYQKMIPQLTGRLLSDIDQETAWSGILFDKELRQVDTSVLDRFEKLLKKLDGAYSSAELSGMILEQVRKTMRSWPLTLESLRNSDWHELRSEMKWVLAVLPLMLEGDRFSRPMKDILKHTAELVGEWHDLYQCLAWCQEKASQYELNDEDPEQLFVQLAKGLGSRGAQFEMAYGALIEQLEFNAFLE